MDAAETASDAELLRRFTESGDRSAFELVVRRHAEPVWGVCRSALPRDAQTAEDAFQATFLALVRKAGSVRAGRRYRLVLRAPPADNRGNGPATPRRAAPLREKPMRLRNYAIIGTGLVVLVGGLLIPGIAKVRAAAAHMTCISSLKGQACAAHLCAESFGNRFPKGAIPNAELAPDQRLSWYVSILPYMEQDRLYRHFDVSLGAHDPRNSGPTGYRLRHLACPASDEYDRATQTWKSPTPLTHYVGVAGVGEDAALLTAKHPRAGIFGYDRQAPLAGEPTKGYSQTLLIMETANNPGHWAHGGPATVRGIVPGTAPYFGAGQPFGGFHDEGWNWFQLRRQLCCVAFADATTRILSSDVTSEVLEALATLGGKEAIPENW